MRKLILLLMALTAFGLYEGMLLFKQPENFSEKAVDIPANSSLKSVSNLLYSEGVIKDQWSFLLLGKISGAARRIQAGEFMFHQPSSPSNALQTLRYAKVVLHRVTVPEGSTVAEMAPWFEQAKIISGQEFLESSRNKVYLSMFQVPSDRMEGYLFPSTYLFPKNERIQNIFKIMYNELEKNISLEDRQKALALGWQLHQWITFASVIEKETNNPIEYGLVSGVFHNRLKKGMKLQSDPTVIYGIENYDGNIRKKDLLTDTPYNTYTRKGLPIGPVSNPGASAIHYAVNPTASDYLYFVGNGQGAHVFTKTYEEHLKAVRQYQLHQ